MFGFWMELHLNLKTIGKYYIEQVVVIRLAWLSSVQNNIATSYLIIV